MNGDRAKAAESLARRLHASQTDQGGRPYVEHLEAVVRILLRRWPDAPEEAIEAAWLHDAIEDHEQTGASPALLAAEGVSPEAIRLVGMLSRPKGMPYLAWITDLAASGDQWTIRIKSADNEHNSDPTRRIPGSSLVERRYIPAKALLDQALAR